MTVLRTRTDADRILAAGRSCRCVCIGGGLLGLETAGALARRGADVTLLEGSGWLLPRQLNERAGRALEARLGGIGIRLRNRARTRELVGDEQVRGVSLEDGATLPADLVVIATGVRPNSYKFSTSRCSASGASSRRTPASISWKGTSRGITPVSCSGTVA